MAKFATPSARRTARIADAGVRVWTDASLARISSTATSVYRTVTPYRGCIGRTRRTASRVTRNANLCAGDRGLKIARFVRTYAKGRRAKLSARIPRITARASANRVIRIAWAAVEGRKTTSVRKVASPVRKRSSTEKWW
jgi:hypothetical protein